MKKTGNLVGLKCHYLVVLSIGRLGPSGGAEYYLATVAAGVDDYYVGGREAAGRWVGGGAAELGLDGEVGAQAFRAVLAGRDPLRDRPLGRSGRRIPGFDLTFSAPKSVSVLWGLSDRRVAAEVRAAHDAAVAAAVDYLEAEVIRCRRGHNGVESVPTLGVIAAAFVHRTSRAGDPQLHTHAAPRGALPYPPLSGERLEVTSLGPMAHRTSKEEMGK